MDSPYASGGWIAAMVVVALLAFAIAVPLGATLLRLAVRWLAGFTPGFGTCCGTVLVAVGLCWAGNAAVAIALYAYGRQFGGVDISAGSGQWAYLAGTLALDVAMHALAVGFMLRRPDGARLAHGDALRIAATYLAMVLGLMLAVVGALAGLFALRR